jgi:hypothetical protein
MVNPASYSGGLWFTSRLGDRLSWVKVFVVFSLQASAGIIPELRPRPLSYMFFPIHHWLIALLFNAKESRSLKKAWLNKMQTNKHVGLLKTGPRVSKSNRMGWRGVAWFWSIWLRIEYTDELLTNVVIKLLVLLKTEKHTSWDTRKHSSPWT